jgi:hypothetical protein
VMPALTFATPTPAASHWSWLVEASVGRHSEKPRTSGILARSTSRHCPRSDLHARSVIPGSDAFADVEGVGGRQKALKRSTGDLFEGLPPTFTVTSHAAGHPSPSKNRTASGADFDDEPGLFPERSSSR